MDNKSFNRITRLIFLCTIMVSMLSGFALADVIFEPENDFYKSHSNECQYVNRSYYANGESGFMEIYSKPNGASQGFANNGELFLVQFSYMKNNEIWGVVEYSKNGDKLISRENDDFKTGWIKMSNTVLKYDYISFEEEHTQDIKPYEGDYSELSGVKNIVIWTFPSSGEKSGSLEEIDDNFAVDSEYTDSDGLSWAYVGYYYGSKDFWICLSDPTNTEIPAAGFDIPEFFTAAPGVVPHSSTKDMTIIIVICVAAVVIISAVLIVVLGKQKVKLEK